MKKKIDLNTLFRSEENNHILNANIFLKENFNDFRKFINKGLKKFKLEVKQKKYPSKKYSY